MVYQWREDKRQKSWLWVGLLFFAFYFTEAILFWGPGPRVAAPSFTPLVFWGLFGLALIWVITRPVADGGKPTRLERLQSLVLGTAITAASVGSAFLIIRRTGDLALGHSVLLFSLAQAGAIIGAMLFNWGWLAAAFCWLAGGAWIFCDPANQDLIIGAAVAMGFVLIGAFRKCFVSSNSNSSV